VTATRAQKIYPLINRLQFGCLAELGEPDLISKERFTNDYGANWVDNSSSKKRSEIMAKVRSRDNASTEIKALQILRSDAITGWRRHLPMFGHPDFAFPKTRVVLFIDGCFWHGCPRCYQPPKSSAAFWRQKLHNNKRRDREVSKQLRKSGWKVIRLWECQLKSPARLLRLLKDAT